MNLKALIEKRNALLSEAEEILNRVSVEVRALTNEENSEYDLKIAEVEEINQTIKKIEERSVQETTEEVVEPVAQEEEREMEKENIKDFEIRALDQLIRKKDGEELSSSERGDLLEQLAGEYVSKKS